MKIKLFVGLSLVGCNIEEIHDLNKDYGISDEEWNDMSPEEKETMLNDIAHDFHYNHIDFGAAIVEE